MAVKLGINKWLMALGLAMLVVLGTSNVVFTLAAFLISIIAIMLYKNDEDICIIFFLLSFTHIFKIRPGTPSLFTYICLFYVAWYMIRNLTVPIVVGEILVFSAYLYVVQGFNGANGIVSTVKFAANLLFVYIVLHKVTPANVKNILFAYVLGVVVASFLKVSGLFPNIPFYTYEDAIDAGRFTGMHQDPNYYSVNVIIALCLVVILFHRKELRGYIALPIAVALVYFIGLTASKAAFLMLIWPLVLLIYSNSKNRKHFIQICIVGAAILFVTKMLAGEVGFLNSVLRRFRNIENVNDLTTGRTDKWLKYIEYCTSSIRQVAFGSGLSAPGVGGDVAHNTYCDILYYLGIIGGGMLTKIFCDITKEYSIKQRVGNVSKNILNVSIFLTLAVMYASLSELLYFDMPYHMLLAIVVFNMDLRNKTC